MQVENIPQEILEESDDDFQSLQNNPRKPALPMPLQILLKFIIVWQFCFKVSDAAIGFLMIFFQKFLRLLESLEIIVN